MFNSSSKTEAKNMINSLMNSVLPDSRPLTSIQIVEDYLKCPKNYISISRTYDQDSDADLYKENILFGKKTTRYLCLSKSEGPPEYIVEGLKVIGEKDKVPEGFSILQRTADTGVKPWRKKQIVYKLTKRGLVTQAITDVILCSKSKQAPIEFKSAGEINGVLICYKQGAVTHRQPPSVPNWPNVNQVTNGIKNINLEKPLPPVPIKNHYENILSYQNQSLLPIRPAPKTPTNSSYQTGTLGVHAEIEGVPFILNPNISYFKSKFEMPTFTTVSKLLDYDFILERQILCTTKSTDNKNGNPFFQ